MTEHFPERHFQLTWDEFHRHCKAVAWANRNRTFDLILGVSRGGLVPAVIMARELEIRVVESIGVQSYEEYTVQGEFKIIKDISEDAKRLIQDGGKNMMVVDDLVDTGATYLQLRTLFPNAYFVSIYAKPKGVSAVDYHFIQVGQETWIYLPWDVVPDGRAYAPPMVQKKKSTTEIEASA